jgi:hypothetical protein
MYSLNSKDFLVIVAFLGLLYASLFYLNLKAKSLYDRCLQIYLAFVSAVLAGNFYHKNGPLNAELTSGNSLVFFGIFLAFMALANNKIIRKYFIIFVIFFLTANLIYVLSENSSLLSTDLKSANPVFSKNKKNVIYLVVDTARSDIFLRELENLQIDGLMLYKNYFSNFTSTFTSVPFGLSMINPIHKKYSEFQREFVCDNLQSHLKSKGWDVYNSPYEYLKASFPLASCNTSYFYKNKNDQLGVLDKIKMQVSVFFYLNNNGNYIGKYNPLIKLQSAKINSSAQILSELGSYKVANTNKNVFYFIHVNGLHSPLPKAFSKSSLADDYESESRVIASQIKTIIEDLKKANISKETTMVILGDHGFYLWPESYPAYIKSGNLGGRLIYEFPYIKGNSNRFYKLMERFGRIGEDGFLNKISKANLHGKTLEDILSKSKSVYIDNASEILQLSKAALAVINFNDKGVHESHSIVDTESIHNFIRSELASKIETKEKVKVFYTPFFGGINNELVSAFATCDLDNLLFSCTSTSSDVSNSKEADLLDSVDKDSLLVMVTSTSPLMLDKDGGVESFAQGSNVFRRSELVNARVKNLEKSKILIQQAQKVNDKIFAFNADLDATGVVSLLGFETIMYPKKIGQDIRLRLKTANSNNAKSNINFDLCGTDFNFLNNHLSIFEINYKTKPSCETLKITSDAPYNPLLDGTSKKDDRFIMMQVENVELNNSWAGIEGVSYPEEKLENNLRLKWFASTLSIIDVTGDKIFKGIHVFPSKTGDVFLTATYGNGEQEKMKIHTDSFIKFDGGLFKHDVQQLKIETDHAFEHKESNRYLTFYFVGEFND